MSDRVSLAVHLTPAQVRPIAYRVISRKYGINLKSSALQVLADHLGHKFGNEWRGPRAEKFLDELARSWRDEDRGLFLEGEELATVIKNTENVVASQLGDPGLRTQSTTDAPNKPGFHWRDYYKVVTLQKQRKFVYSFENHRFDLGTPPLASILGDTKARTSMVPSRYYILLDRIQRSGVFNTKERELTPIKNMIGQRTTHFFIFGLLAKLQGESGGFSLVDNTSRVALELGAHTHVISDHYYCEGSFAICEGELSDGKFYVLSMGPPIPEPRLASKEAFGSIDFLGLISSSRTQIERIDANLEQVLVQEEARNTHHRIVVLGADLFLDQVQHLDALRHVLAKLEQQPPVGLVLVGSFCSMPFHQANSLATYTELMSALVLLLKQFPRICSETKISVVPGNNDPWHSADSEGSPAWPLMPLPEIFTRRLGHAVKDINFTSNPSRMCYLSQEILVCTDRYGERFKEVSMDWSGDAEQDEDQLEQMGDEAEQEQGEHPSLADTLADLEIDEELIDRQMALNDLAQSQPLPKRDWIHNSTNEEARKLVSTLLDQAHLSPFTTEQRPIVWESEQALSLAQWPTILIVADTTSPRFAVTYHDCIAFNPGKFLRAGSIHWLEYTPHNRTGVLQSESFR